MHVQNFAVRKKVLGRKEFRRDLRQRLRLEERQNARTLPAVLGWWHAGLTKQCLLGIGLRIGVFDTDTQGIQRIERIAHRLHAVLRADQAQLKHAEPAVRFAKTMTQLI